jgi:hypothetical protein
MTIAGNPMSTVVLAVIFSALAALGGGAIGGVVTGGKDIGYQLAALMGAFYGPMAGLLGVAVGLGVLLIIG